MSLERKPSYFAIIPANVRYDTDLRPNAKLLYAEISALSDAEGYCWATNRYLAALFGLSQKTISDLISTLADKGYIFVEVQRDPASNQITERRIWLEQPQLPVDLDPIPENGDTPTASPIQSSWQERPQLPANLDPIPKNGDTPMAKNEDSPIPKNGEENNKDLNIPPIVPQKVTQRLTRREKNEPRWKPAVFANFWDRYPLGKAKQAAIRAWDKLRPDEALLATMAEALHRHQQSELWQSGIGIPYASTWLNQRRWEDEERVLPVGDKPLGGAPIETEELPQW